MLGLFGNGRFLEPEIEDWVLEAWAWLLARLGGMERLVATPLVLANRDFFPPTDTEGAARGAYLFERIRALMGLEGWPCELEAVERPRSGLVAQFVAIQPGRAANGTFVRTADGALIRYAIDLVAQPRVLIPTLAHELAHYRLSAISDERPGGEALEELLTELTVAFRGFGVFAANAAFAFGQHGDAFSQGWRSSRNGYLSERTWAFAVALFCALKGVEIPSDQLKPSVADLTRKAAHYLKRNAGRLEPLRRIS
jgi:hypothetical protein